MHRQGVPQPRRLPHRRDFLMPSCLRPTVLLALSYCMACIACSSDSFPHHGNGDDISAYLSRISVTHAAALEKDASTSVNLKFRELVDPKQEVIGLRGREFIGFCEGRLRFDFPDWWEAQFVKGRLNPSPWFNSPEASQLWTIAGGHKTSGVKSLSFVENAVLVVSSTGDKCRLDRGVIAEVYHSFEDFREDKVSLSVAMSTDHCLVYSFDSVVCVNRSTGDIAWKCVLPHIVEGHNTSGIRNYFFSVQVNDGRVGCFRHDYGNIMFAIIDETTGSLVAIYDSAFICRSTASSDGNTDDKPSIQK